jgi:alginate O-acetyltransferase complex protein AlgI
MRDFWRRWHISLSTWLRDYLYLPLGGNRGGRLQTQVNLLAVFFLCGLWHGASWTFAVWGLWHGFFLVLERNAFFKRLLERAGALGHVYVILVFVCGWVIFRASSLRQAIEFLQAMVFPASHAGAVALRPHLSLVFWFALLAGVTGATGLPARWWHRAESVFSQNSAAWQPWEWGKLTIGAVMFALSIMALMAGTYNPFIYFRF